MAVLPLMVFCAGAALVVYCWKQIGTQTGIAGVGEGVRSTVSSPFPARVHELFVRPYQFVNAGDAVAVIVPNDPRIELGLLQTELDMARIGLQPSIAEENAMNFEQIRVDLLRTKTELAIARVNLQRAENQVNRNEPLFHEKLVSEDIYDLSLKTRDMYAVEVLEKSKAIAEIEKRFAELESLGVPQNGTNSEVEATLAQMRVFRSAVATNWGPITLRSPISGMVTSIARRDGENVIQGEPLICVSSLESERVVGYLRQPYPLQPDIGMEVTMTTRERQPRRFAGMVTEIGAQVEIITNALAFVRPGALVDAGLPVIVSLPRNVGLRPGEIVDLSFQKRRRAPAGSDSARAQHVFLQ